MNYRKCIFELEQENPNCTWMVIIALVEVRLTHYSTVCLLGDKHTQTMMWCHKARSCWHATSTIEFCGIIALFGVFLVSEVFVPIDLCAFYVYFIRNIWWHFVIFQHKKSKTKFVFCVTFFLYFPNSLKYFSRISCKLVIPSHFITFISYD